MNNTSTSQIGVIFRAEQYKNEQNISSSIFTSYLRLIVRGFLQIPKTAFYFLLTGFLIAFICYAKYLSLRSDNDLLIEIGDGNKNPSNIQLLNLSEVWG